MPKSRGAPVFCLAVLALVSTACVTRPAEPRQVYQTFNSQRSLEIFADADAALRAAEEALTAEGLTLLDGEHPANVRRAAAPGTQPEGTSYQVRVTAEGPRLSIVISGRGKGARTDPPVIEQAEVTARTERIRDGIRRRLERSGRLRF